jgi:site-specific DNA-methyltransferase (cytosine-N4-specific)
MVATHSESAFTATHTHGSPEGRATSSAQLALLRDVEWDFAGRETGSDLENLHPYPAKFIPDIPSAILDCLPPPPGTAVLDPFVGSGTTLVECQRRGIPSIGVDLNPIACLISRVKTSPLPQGLVSVGQQVIERKTRLVAHAPQIPNVDHWFSETVKERLAKLRLAISTAPLRYRDALRLALSSIIVKVSRQDSDTRYAAIDKNINGDDVVRLFMQSLTRIAFALQKRDYALAHTRVIEQDALSLTRQDVPSSVGAVITSPPYPNAYEYWLYHKYRMWWLGHDPIAVKRQEIGARAHFFKKDHHTSGHFFDQMTVLFSRLVQMIHRDGYACFVIGRSKIHGSIIDNAEIINDVGAAYGFRNVFEAERTIAASRKSFNLSHANIKSETVLVLAR